MTSSIIRIIDTDKEINLNDFNEQTKFTTTLEKMRYFKYENKIYAEVNEFKSVIGDYCVNFYYGIMIMFKISEFDFV